MHQKQPFTYVLKNRCFSKLKPVSLLKTATHDFMKFLETHFFASGYMA